MKIAIIGAGISGLSIAHCLRDKHEIKIFEKDSQPGGLIKCKKVNNSLYHLVGGHVFNSKREDVLNWFWHFFNRDIEFTKSVRNATISMDNSRFVGYPIENNISMLDADMQRTVIQEWLNLSCSSENQPLNFEDFLRNKFGETLYEKYFKPYNEKIWRKSLKSVPLSWLEGKLPMPTIEEMIFNNFNHSREQDMVHSSFYYAKENGSQFLADRLSSGLDIIYNTEVCNVRRHHGKWVVNEYECDYLLLCGNVKELPELLKESIDISSYTSSIEELEYHGTTSVFCEIDNNPYSWVYMPSKQHSAHRIICTGNFSPENNAGRRLTGTIEFTDCVAREEICRSLAAIPFAPMYLDHTYTKYTYPVQNIKTREMIKSLKSRLRNDNVLLLGRFAEWEYYNMDAAIGAAIDLGNEMIDQ